MEKIIPQVTMMAPDLRETKEQKAGCPVEQEAG